MAGGGHAAGCLQPLPANPRTLPRTGVRQKGSRPVTPFPWRGGWQGRRPVVRPAPAHGLWDSPHRNARPKVIGWCLVSASRRCMPCRRRAPVASHADGHVGGMGQCRPPAAVARGDVDPGSVPSGPPLVVTRELRVRPSVRIAAGDGRPVSGVVEHDPGGSMGSDHRAVGTLAAARTLTRSLRGLVYVESGQGQYGGGSNHGWPVGQSSTAKPGTRWNSRRFRVSSVMPRERAWAAMNKSWLPMGVPLRSNVARMSA